MGVQAVFSKDAKIKSYFLMVNLRFVILGNKKRWLWFVHNPLPPVTKNFIQFLSAPPITFLYKKAPKISLKCLL